MRYGRSRELSFVGKHVHGAVTHCANFEQNQSSHAEEISQKRKKSGFKFGSLPIKLSLTDWKASCWKQNGNLFPAIVQNLNQICLVLRELFNDKVGTYKKKALYIQ